MKKLLTILLLSMMSTLMAGFNSTLGVVTDSVTTLEWQDDYSDNAGVVKQTNWENAIAYCEALALDGGGWRLPNIRELNSIVDYSKYNPAIDSVFSNNNTNYYWSSTVFSASSETGFGQDAKVIHFGNGGQYSHYKGSSDYVRCVRAGQ